jgi:sugar phosphate isomerase/epimerase
MNRRQFSKLLATSTGSVALLSMGDIGQADSSGSGNTTKKPAKLGDWKLSLSEISTINATFKDDLKAYATAGFDAIGLWEFKLPNDDSVGAALHDAGLAVANCVPAVPSILPWSLPGMEGPRDPKERIAKLCASMGRLAKYNPASVLVISGPIGNFALDKAREIVVEGLREIGAAARSAGVRLGLEPIHPMQHDTTSFVNTIASAMGILKDANFEGLGIMADTYNLWNEKPADLAAIAKHVTGLHVADVPKEPGRTDRVLPLEGGTQTAALASALIEAGWSGIVDIEIFSTPDRFWGLPVDEAARRAHAADVSLGQKLPSKNSQTRNR